MSGQAEGYTVKRAFKYNGRMYQPGEVWIPEGGKYDGQIIAQAQFVHPHPASEKGLLRARRMAEQQKREKAKEAPAPNPNMLRAATKRRAGRKGKK